MSGVTQVESVARGWDAEWVITVSRNPQEGACPFIEDVPSDIREALAAWLEISPPRSSGVSR